MTKQKKLKQSRNVLSTLFIIGLLMQGCGNASSGSNPTAADSGSETATNEPNYFEELDSASSTPPDEDVRPVRYRMVKADIAALKQSIQSGRSTIRLDLFRDKSVTVAIEDVQKISDNNYVVTGHVQGQPLSSVSVVIKDNVVTANVHQAGGNRYSIDFVAGGAHAVQEVEDVADESECATPTVPETLQPEEGTNSAQATTKPVIDMLVAYTPGARSKAGGTSAMIAKIQMGIADTNRAYANSGVNLQVRLVGTMEVRQNETGNFSADLGYLRGKTDGRWDEVHARRAALGADQVTMVGTFPNQTVAGIANIKATASYAFSVVKLSAFSIYTFTHELGHNIGLQHSDGYLNSSGRFRTIMAYGSVPRILRFSNPSLAYSGFSTGNSTHNSARKLNLYGGTTASLYASKTLSTASKAASLTSSEAPQEMATAADMDSQANLQEAASTENAANVEETQEAMSVDSESDQNSQ